MKWFAQKEIVGIQGIESCLKLHAKENKRKKEILKEKEKEAKAKEKGEKEKEKEKKN